MSSDGSSAVVYSGREQREQAMEHIAIKQQTLLVDGKKVDVPGCKEIMDIYRQAEDQVRIVDGRRIPSVPVKPCGWRILVDPVEIERYSEGGIELPPEAIRAQEHLRYTGTVLDVGPLAYRDKRFAGPDGTPAPWCKVGDMVTFGRHAGQEVLVREGKDSVRKLRLLQDDEILAVITDPAAIQIPY